jgi:hypothetical protein
VLQRRTGRLLLHQQQGASGPGVTPDLAFLQVLHSDIDLLNPPAELEKQKHKLKRLVQSPNSFFMVSTRADGFVATHL